MGAVHDSQGSYFIALAGCVALIGVAAILFLFLPLRRAVGSSRISAEPPEPMRDGHSGRRGVPAEGDTL
jgi:hypothetical protein